MTGLVTTVECVVCHKTHLEMPPLREDGTLNPRDFTYYRDNYRDLGYSVVCKRDHDAELAPKLSKLES